MSQEPESLRCAAGMRDRVMPPYPVSFHDPRRDQQRSPWKANAQWRLDPVRPL